MKVVSPSGTITDSKDSFDWGCSHSGYERITCDERPKSFASICKTDSNNRLMPPNNWDATIYRVNLVASVLGDIVPDSVASSNKYWSSVSNGDGYNAKVYLIHYDLKSKASEDIVLDGTDANERAPHVAPIVPDSVASSNKYWSSVSNGDGYNAKVYLIHYDLKSKASEDIVLDGTDANERAPHVAPIGKDGLLAMWEGGSSGGDLQEGGDRTIYAQVLDRATGKTISSKATVDKSVVSNRYQALPGRQRCVPVEGLVS
ncbi:hypothetical protein PR003_g21743 [Phytophthora rubi]|nr:hypothetical protein PR002_g10752 [Phytophthora rubi]KAE9304458.1 hypothetical protein PR003_g21743 [Phytophthora rubi]